LKRHACELGPRRSFRASNSSTSPTLDHTKPDGHAVLKARDPPPEDPGNSTANFHGETHRNDTHQSTTDPDAQLARKGQGKEAKLS
jgi:hypothetical protein